MGGVVSDWEIFNAVIDIISFIFGLFIAYKVVDGDEFSGWLVLRIIVLIFFWWAIFAYIWLIKKEGLELEI
jgi:hypothetical protein